MLLTEVHPPFRMTGATVTDLVQGQYFFPCQICVLDKDKSTYFYITMLNL